MNRLIGIFFVSAVFGAPIAAVAAGPSARVESPVHQFGTVSQGTKVVHEFGIKNSGDADLNIQRVVPACGCTAAVVSSDRIAAGAEGAIKVEFDTTGFSGEKVKNVRVYTNDIDHSTILLTMKGAVEPEISVEPQRVFFGDVGKGSGTSPEELVTVAVRDGSPATITGAKAFSQHVTLEELDSGSKQRRFKISLGPEAPVGELRERIVVTLSGGKNQSINIPIFASIKGPVRLTPSTLSFGIIEGSTLLERTVKLENRGQQAVEIGRVVSKHPAVTVDVRPVHAGKTYVLNVKVDPQQVTTDLRASVSIETKGLQNDTLELSVYGVLPPKV